jgi:hypothetical protein
METLNVGDLVDLWESWNDRGKLHIGYNVCVDTSTFFIYQAQGPKSASLFHQRLYSFCTRNGHSLTRFQHCEILDQL